MHFCALHTEIAYQNWRALFGGLTFSLEGMKPPPHANAWLRPSVNHLKALKIS